MARFRGLAFATNVVVNKGDVISDPKHRDPQSIAEDLMNGYLTEERVEFVYKYR